MESNQPARILAHVKNTARQGDPFSVISTIDEYCRTERSMNVGETKGKILDSIVNDCKPKVALELGVFYGYSSIRTAQLLGEGCTLYSVEINPTYAQIATEMIKFAGLQKKVKVLVGNSDEVLPVMQKNHGIEAFDFVFIDHWKDQYKPDLLLLEKLNLIRKGTVILADNVIYPGCPDYLEYVRNNPNYECTNFPAKLGHSNKMDALEKSVYVRK